MRTFTHFTGLVLLLSSLQTAFAQHPITVLDAIDRQPLVGATIEIPGHKGGHTDTAGVYRANLPIGTPFKVRYLGYSDYSGVLAANTSVLLLPADQTLTGVVVSATLKPVSKAASPIPVEVYQAKFFHKNTSAALFEAVERINGVRPQLTCNVCNTGGIQINGMAAPYTMVTIDGMPIVSGLSTVYGLMGIPNGIIERLEVVKGPASTLYGSEAVGGLLNIITKDAATAPKIYGTVFGTTNKEWNGELALAHRWRKVNGLFGVQVFDFQNRLDINRDNFTDMALQRRLSLFNKWQWKRPKDRVATVAARYHNEHRWGGEMNWTPEWEGTDSIYGESIYTRRWELMGKYQLPFDRHKVLLDASWNAHRQDSYYGTTPFFANQQVFFSQLTSDLHFGSKHQPLAGIAFRATLYNDNTPATSTSDGLEDAPSLTLLPGIFLQDEYEMTRYHTLLMGLRLDHNSAHGPILTPRLSWKWSRVPQHVFRATAGSGYRVANIFTEDHAALTGARTVVVEEGLQPERSWNANLNYAAQFFPKRAGFIGLDASAFFTYFSNQIVPDYLTDPNSIIFANLDGYGISSGVSLSSNVNFVNGITVQAGLSWMHVYRVENDQRLPQLFAPPLSGTWTVTLPVKKWGFALDYTGNFNSPMYLPVVPNDYRPERSPWYALHHVQVTQQLMHDLELIVGVKNVLGFYPKGQIILRAFDPFDKQVHLNNPNNYTFDPTYSYAPIQRQRVLVGLRWKIHD